MNPEQIARLITEDPDVSGEEVILHDLIEYMQNITDLPPFEYGLQSGDNPRLDIDYTGKRGKRSVGAIVDGRTLKIFSRDCGWEQDIKLRNPDAFAKASRHFIEWLAGDDSDRFMPFHPTINIYGIPIDTLIAPIMRILLKSGITTLGSCQGDATKPSSIDIDTADIEKFYKLVGGKKPRWMSIRVDRSKHRKNWTYVSFPHDKIDELAAIIKANNP